MGDPNVKKTPWNQTPAPSSMTEGMQKSREQGYRVAGASYVSSKETPQRAEQAGGMKSEKFSGKMKAANVKKSTLTSPPMDMGPMPRDGGKY